MKGTKQFGSILVSLMFIVTVFLAVAGTAAANGTVILHPGYITGTISITGETVDYGRVDAYSLPLLYDGHDYTAENGDYFVTVEGDYDYEVLAEARMDENTQDYYSNTYVDLKRETTYVAIGNTVNLDISLDPGYIAPTVTVIGGEIERMYFYTYYSYDSADQEYYNSRKYINGKNVWDSSTSQWVFQYLDGSTIYPTMPQVSYDANSDGDYNDWGLGDTYVFVRPQIWVNDIIYYLEDKYIDVLVGDTTYVNWEIDVTPGTISGSVDVLGETVNNYYFRGSAEIGDTQLSIQEYYSGTQDYYEEVPATCWTIWPDMYFYDTTTLEYTMLSLVTIADEVTVGPGDDIINDFYTEPGYIEGSINLFGANTDLWQAYIYADNPDSAYYPYNAYTRTQTNDYQLILHEGDWHVGYPYMYLYFDYPSDPEPDLYSYIRTMDYGIHYSDTPISVASGQTVTDVDFSYGTATITLNYIVEGGGELRDPSLNGYQYEGTWPDTFYSYSYGYGSHDLTTLGECTITVLAGTHDIDAYAYVEDSKTKFGELTITVEPGDVITQDIGAPSVDVEQPGGYDHICGSSVLVEGTATDDNEIVSITVNGVEVDFESTNNPDDPNEVSFSTTVEGLDYGENTITVVVTDTFEKTTTVERIVIRDVCNQPPTADAGGPYEGYVGSPITLDASGSSDPNEEDELMYRWDFDNDGIWDTDWSSDPTVEHAWDYDYTGDVVVQVSDGIDTVTDTASVTVLTAEQAKHVILDYILALPDEAFVNNPDQHKNALQNKFLAVDKQIQNGAYNAAIHKLNHDIRACMDGDATPTDWIIDPMAQAELTTMIDGLTAYLATL
jgi:hypothetical protein